MEDSNSSSTVSSTNPPMDVFEPKLTPRVIVAGRMKKEAPKKKPLLGYRGAFPKYLFLVYIPLLVIPWVFTCILSTRPLTGSSYYEPSGKYSSKDIAKFSAVWQAVRVLTSLTSLLTIPIISGVLAQAAVIYTQRRKAKQELSLRQLFAIADRGWSNISIIFRSIKFSDQPHKRTGFGSTFLYMGAGLLLLAFVQQPLQQLLVSTTVVQVPTCTDIPYLQWSSCEDYTNQDMTTYIQMGLDPEPALLAQIPQSIVVQEILKHTAQVNEYDRQPYLWAESNNPSNSHPIETGTFLGYFSDQFTSVNTSGYFQAAIPSGTTTGVLREHALRMNSSVSCELIPKSQFPTSCPGSNPFTATYAANPPINVSLELSVCASGNQTAVPWTISRNRQDISEELFINLGLTNTAGELGPDGPGNFTLHCTSTTTRGYFELGSYQNNFKYGPLLQEWPDSGTLASEFNDYTRSGKLPTVSDPLDSSDWIGSDAWIEPINSFQDLNDGNFANGPSPTPGPLTTSAIALFGNYSFLYNAMQNFSATDPQRLDSLCQSADIPFQQLSGRSAEGNFTNAIINMAGTPPCQTRYQVINGMLNATENPYSGSELVDFVATWIREFGNVQSANEALSIAVFFANQGQMLKTAAGTADQNTNGPRSIYTAPGSAVTIPIVASAAKIAISALIGVQLLALLVLVAYSYSAPRWTKTLDSYAVASIAASAKDHIPALDQLADFDPLKLKNVGGVVGSEERGAENSTLLDGMGEEGVEHNTPLKLALEAPGIINRGLLKRD